MLTEARRLSRGRICRVDRVPSGVRRHRAPKLPGVVSPTGGVRLRASPREGCAGPACGVVRCVRLPWVAGVKKNGLRARAPGARRSSTATRRASTTSSGTPSSCRASSWRTGAFVRAEQQKAPGGGGGGAGRGVGGPSSRKKSSLIAPLVSSRRAAARGRVVVVVVSLLSRLTEVLPQADGLRLRASPPDGRAAARVALREGTSRIEYDVAHIRTSAALNQDDSPPSLRACSASSARSARTWRAR